MCKGGASHFPASILHWSFHGHKSVSRSNQHRVHHRVQCTDFLGCRLLLFILCPGSDSVSAQKAHNLCDRHDIRPLPARPRRHPYHPFVLGLQCRWYILLILASGLESNPSYHELVCSCLWRGAAFQLVLLGDSRTECLHWTYFRDRNPLKVRRHLSDITSPSEMMSRASQSIVHDSTAPTLS